MIDPHLRQRVIRNAQNRCEYCRISQAAVPLHTFHVEHIVARQHGGEDDPANLCLACHRCNAYKGSNLTAIDPATGEVVSLFHPRRETWREHFVLNGAEVVGLTPVGRATVRLLHMNDHPRLSLRAECLTLGELPGDEAQDMRRARENHAGIE